MRVLLWAGFTDLSATLAERNLSAKGESLAMGFSFINSRIIKLGIEVVTSLLLSLNVLGWDLLGNLFDIHWGFVLFFFF